MATGVHMDPNQSFTIYEMQTVYLNPTGGCKS